MALDKDALSELLGCTARRRAIRIERFQYTSSCARQAPGNFEGRRSLLLWHISS